MVAKFEIIGRATKDVQLEKTSNGKSKAIMRLATNEGQESYYYNIICYNSLAELVAKYVLTGKQVYACGDIKPRTYEKEGNKVHIIDFICREVEFLSGNTKQDDNEPF